jgi:tetratricopeptide (TPR) repeat protein
MVESVGLWRIDPEAMSFLRSAVLAFVLAVFLHFAVLSQTKPPAQIPQAQLEPITAALRAQQFDQAAQLAASALKDFPGDAHLWALRGVALASAGDSKGGVAAFQQALNISPNYLMALQGAAEIEFQVGAPDAAPLLNRLLRLRPDDPVAHAMSGVLRYRRGDCAGAASHFDKAGAVLDAQPAALHAFAICLVRLQQVGRAVNVFQTIVSANPEDQHERRLLAAIQVMAHKSQEAVVTLEPLLRGGVADAETLELASAAYEDSGDTPNAVSTLRQAILLDPKNVNLYLDFVHICYLHQSFEVGIDVVGEGIAQLPTAAPLYLARGVLYVQLSHYDKAEADFEKAHEVDPTQSLSVAAQSMAAVQENDLNRALATVQVKLAKRPNDAYLLYLQADILSQTGAAPGTPEFQTAMRSARKAVALQPTLGEARGVLAKLDLLAGQNQEAIKQCRKALQINPKDQTALYRLIQALQKTGSKKEIPDLLRRLASLREQAAKEERDRSRYKLIEGDEPPLAAKP